ncbi:hypothetical protein TNCT_131441 [Trichonephila clavata]|uniref:Uncharacterized protein n=1 Tax=Trichonephila clavata TaxID=2740835 RepID=A0A8X6G8E2_TRICU|nr:hypothetical protein TNCT_131441 [Trichonephila clavata]
MFHCDSVTTGSLTIRLLDPYSGGGLVIQRGSNKSPLFVWGWSKVACRQILHLVKPHTEENITIFYWHSFKPLASSILEIYNPELHPILEKEASHRERITSVA